MNDSWFTEARYGLFIHYGLYSLLERGEWVWNREEIPREEYRALAARFTAKDFDADWLCRMAVDAGMRYVVLTTMHHEGFRLYPTELSDFHIGNSGAAGRDLVAEIIAATRKHRLKVGLYHSLNNWYDQPDAVAALEDPAAYEKFITATHARIRELVTRYNPIDILWYDGWWPFNAGGWQAEKMNAMVREIQPHILFNGRNGLPGDFATPEQHLSAPNPWHPWEACVTMNESWSFHAGDHEWKTESHLLDMLARCSQGNGNLLLNVGPMPDGIVPEPCVRVLHRVGAWLLKNGEAIYGTELFTFSLQERDDHRGDWNFHGPMTVKGNSLFWLLRRPPGDKATLGGLQSNVVSVSRLDNGEALPFTQTGTRLQIAIVPATDETGLWPALRIECDTPPVVYQTGGLRVPKAPHPHYDPCPSDIAH
ncbi:MAG: alpha-L-fucosidase [Verrucomicrobia bacterium]|nr:alpha-L-fucosidase [Verrucomicrobiota bacterium]